MSSFFTLPKSQKRKRDNASAPAHKKSRIGGAASSSKQKSRTLQDDESISGSDSDVSGRDAYESEGSDASAEKETEAEKRLRLAEDYLETVRKETEQEIGFDAEEIDRDLIAERLKEDVAESRGRLYRHIASTYDWNSPSKAFASPGEREVTTAVTAGAGYFYTATKDLKITKWRYPKLETGATGHSNRLRPETIRASSPHPELSKARRRKLREKRRREDAKDSVTADLSWKDGLVKVCSSRGVHKPGSKRSYRNHMASILCLACSPDGKLLVSGGADKRLIVWDATKLVPIRVFTQHRAAVTGLAFRRNKNQLFSASADRTVKVWSLDELAFVETLFGHQDEVLDVGALGLERCVSVGGRDRTARVWKVVEETQLVFRGGGSAATKEAKRDRKQGKPVASELAERKAHSAYGEGSIDRVALVDDDMFVTGSDNGSLSLWSVQRKKPVHTIALAHGLDPPLSAKEAFADLDLEERPEVPGPPLPRWITSLAAVPYSDLIISGSWDGHLRVWQISQDKKRLEALGTIEEKLESSDPALSNGLNGFGSDSPDSHVDDKSRHLNGLSISSKQSKGAKTVKGIVNDLTIFEEGERGKEVLYVLAGTGREHRLGRWLKCSGRNGVHLFAVSKSQLQQQ